MRYIRVVCVLTFAMAGIARAQSPAEKAPAAEAPAAAPAVAQVLTSGVPTEQPATEAAVHDELRALQKTMEDALNARDLDALLANVDDRLVFTAMNAEYGYGKDFVRNYFHKMLNGEDKIVENIKVDFVPDALATFYGPDVAVSAGNADSHYELTNGMKFDVMARWTATLVRKDGRWLVASFHYSTNMFKNPVLDAQRKWLIMAGAGGALILGILGFLIGRKTGRRTG